MKYAITALALSIASLGFTLPQAVTAYSNSVRIGGDYGASPVKVTITNPSTCY